MLCKKCHSTCLFSRLYFNISPIGSSTSGLGGWHGSNIVFMALNKVGIKKSSVAAVQIWAKARTHSQFYIRNAGFPTAGSHLSASLTETAVILVYFQTVSAYTVCIFSGCHFQVLAPAFFQRRKVLHLLQRWRSVRTTKPAVRLVFVFFNTSVTFISSDWKNWHIEMDGKKL